VTLLGRGVLAIWNGIAPEVEDDFAAWHVREHIPERVSLPGFLRGRRFVAVDAAPKYFNFYETSSVADLKSPAYLTRLNAPTDWTRKVVAHFTDTSRTLCQIAWSLGQGEGGFVEALAVRTSVPPDTFAAKLWQEMSQAYAADQGLVAAHLLEGQMDGPLPATMEQQLRGKPDATAPWVLLVEASSAEALFRFRSGDGAAATLFANATAEVMQRGIYQQQFALSK
jgi:hypothetical protein